MFSEIQLVLGNLKLSGAEEHISHWHGVAENPVMDTTSQSENVEADYSQLIVG